MMPRRSHHHVSYRSQQPDDAVAFRGAVSVADAAHRRVEGAMCRWRERDLELDDSVA